MKKATALILALSFIVMLTGCGKDNVYQIKITIPAGSTDWFVYSDEDISPTGNKIIISAGDGMKETEVILKTVEVREETAYLPETLAPDKPVILDVEKGAWFKVGVSLQNETETDQTMIYLMTGSTHIICHLFIPYICEVFLYPRDVVNLEKV